MFKFVDNMDESSLIDFNVVLMSNLINFLCFKYFSKFLNKDLYLIFHFLFDHSQFHSKYSDLFQFY